MSKKNGRALGIEFGNVLIEPAESCCRYSSLLRFCSFAGIKADDLPATVSKGVVDLARENFLVSGPIGH